MTRTHLDSVHEILGDWPYEPDWKYDDEGDSYDEESWP